MIRRFLTAACNYLPRWRKDRVAPVVVANLVRGMETLERVDENAEGDIARQAHSRLHRMLHERRQRVALYVFHDQEHTMGIVLDIQHLHDVWMSDSRCELPMNSSVSG